MQQAARLDNREQLLLQPSSFLLPPLSARIYGGDEWQKAVKCAVALLASEATTAEAINVREEKDEGRPLTNTALVIVLFAMIGMICSPQLVKDVIYMIANKVYRIFQPADEPKFDYVDEPGLETSHGAIVNAARHGEPEYDLTPMSDEMDVDDEGQEINECGPMAKERWMRLYEEVRAEPGQQKWRWTNEILWTEDVSSQMRGHVLTHILSEKRREEHLTLTLKTDCMSTTDAEIRQWHRFLNSHFNLIVETHVEVRELRKKQEAVNNQSEEDPHEAERKRFQQGLRRDRQQQTYVSYSHVTNEMVHTRIHGAWEFASSYESRV